jgi:hypothetical protein
LKIGHDPLTDPVVVAALDNILRDLDLAKISTITNNDHDRVWRNWITSASYHRVQGLDTLPYSAFVPGTTDAFGEFIARYPSSRVRVSRNDFVLTKILAKSWNRHLVYLEDEPLSANDCAIISLPFSGNGSYYSNWLEFLDQADEFGVPVFVDAAYFGISHGIQYPLDRTCIKDFTISLSKNFAGNPLRLGIRFTKDLIDDGVTAGLLGSDIFDRLGAYIAIELLKTFSHSWTIDRYLPVSQAILQQFNLAATNTVTLALGNKTMQEFKRGDYIRVVISDEISQALRNS